MAIHLGAEAVHRGDGLPRNAADLAVGRGNQQKAHRGLAGLAQALAKRDVIPGQEPVQGIHHRAASCCSIQSRSLDFRAQITLPIRKVGIRTLASPA